MKAKMADYINVVYFSLQYQWRDILLSDIQIEGVNYLTLEMNYD